MSVRCAIHQFQEKDLSVVHFCQQFKVHSLCDHELAATDMEQEMNAACSEIKSSLKFSSLAEDNTARHAKMLSRDRGSRSGKGS